MRWLSQSLLAGVVLLALVGCDSAGVSGPTKAVDPFATESAPYGDPSVDPYRPAGPRPLLDIPAEPKPPEQRKK